MEPPISRDLNSIWVAHSEVMLLSTTLQGPLAVKLGMKVAARHPWLMILWADFVFYGLVADTSGSILY